MSNYQASRISLKSRPTQKPCLAKHAKGFSPLGLGAIERKNKTVTLAVACIALSLSVASAPAWSGDMVLGLGVDNVDKNDAKEAVAAQLEYRFNPVWEFSRGDVAVIGALETDEDRDVYGGVGVSGIFNASANWFVEASFAVGYYRAGSNGADLGSNHQFRSLFALGYRVSEVTRISLAVDHLSNANTGDTNPGRNAVFLRFARSF